MFCAMMLWLLSGLTWSDSISSCKSLSRGMSRVLTGVEDKYICENSVLKFNFTITTMLLQNDDVYRGVIAILLLTCLPCSYVQLFVVPIKLDNKRVSSLFSLSDAFNSIHDTCVSHCNLIQK